VKYKNIVTLDLLEIIKTSSILLKQKKTLNI